MTERWIANGSVIPSLESAFTTALDTPRSAKD